MTARAANGRFTATRTTTERITERITVEEATTVIGCWDDGAIPGTIDRAAGWDDTLLAERHLYREHLLTQQDRCLQFLWDAVESGEITAAQTGSWETFAWHLPDVVRSAVVILRAGPDATPLELRDGRSI